MTRGWPAAGGFTLADLVREHARTHVGRTSLVCGETRLTFDALDARVNRAASMLVANGARRGSRVLWLGQNCHRVAELLFACAKLGAVLVPANWRGSAEEIRFVIEDAAPRVVLWQEEEIGDRVAQARTRAGGDPSWIPHDAAGEDSYEGLLAAAGPGEPAGDGGEDDPVVQMYTAAFEGRPRAALLTNRNLVTTNLHLAIAHRLAWDDVNLVSVPLYHILGLSTMLASFHAGAANVMLRRVEPEEMCRVIATERVTRAVILGPTIGKMVEIAERGRYDLSSLRTRPDSGGTYADRWRALTSPTSLPQAGYGQTEAGGLATFDALGPPGAGSHGRPGPTTVLRILDEDGNEVPDGETGEIAVRGPQVMAGYGRPGEGLHEGWRRTGDVGLREPDGTLSFLGSKTELIKTGAENVYPAEVEAALARHPAVRESCVFGVPDPEWREAVKAVVVPLDRAGAVSAEELLEFCKQHIASYKKPRSIEFASELPRTASGTVDREAVKRLFGATGE